MKIYVFAHIDMGTPYVLRGFRYMRSLRKFLSKEYPEIDINELLYAGQDRTDGVEMRVDKITYTPD